jgi:hypothetical protein
METLIRELESLRKRPHLSNNEVAGAMVAMTVRLGEILDQRIIGIQAIASAVAMQPQIDVIKLHADFMSFLKSHFESVHRIPSDLKDIAAGIKLAGADRN